MYKGKKVGSIWLNDGGKWGRLVIEIKGVKMKFIIEKAKYRRGNFSPAYIVRYSPKHNQQLEHLLGSATDEEVPF